MDGVLRIVDGSGEEYVVVGMRASFILEDKEHRRVEVTDYLLRELGKLQLVLRAVAEAEA